MSDIVAVVGAIAGLAVAVGALVVSVGVYVLVSKLGNAIESMSRTDE